MIPVTSVYEINSCIVRLSHNPLKLFFIDSLHIIFVKSSRAGQMPGSEAELRNDKTRGSEVNVFQKEFKLTSFSIFYKRIIMSLFQLQKFFSFDCRLLYCMKALPEFREPG